MTSDNKPGSSPPLLSTMSKIVCPVDFREASIETLKVADQLAHRFSASLTLLYVLPPTPMTILPPVGGAIPTEGPDGPKFRDELEESQLKALKDLGEKHLSCDTPVSYVVLQGDTADEIVHFARKQHADLIVISTHGRTGLRHFLFGSTAEKVIRHAKCPVLTMRHPDKEDD